MGKKFVSPILISPMPSTPDVLHCSCLCSLESVRLPLGQWRKWTWSVLRVRNLGQSGGWETGRDRKKSLESIATMLDMVITGGSFLVGANLKLTVVGAEFSGDQQCCLSIHFAGQGSPWVPPLPCPQPIQHGTWGQWMFLGEGINLVPLLPYRHGTNIFQTPTICWALCSFL